MTPIAQPFLSSVCVSFWWTSKGQQTVQSKSFLLMSDFEQLLKSDKTNVISVGKVGSLERERSQWLPSGHNCHGDNLRCSMCTLWKVVRQSEWQSAWAIGWSVNQVLVSVLRTNGWHSATLLGALKSSQITGAHLQCCLWRWRRKKEEKK